MTRSDPMMLCQLKWRHQLSNFVTPLLVARGLPRDTENIPVYWKNVTSGLSFKVSILGQHFWSALASAFAT